MIDRIIFSTKIIVHTDAGIQSDILILNNRIIISDQLRIGPGLIGRMHILFTGGVLRFFRKHRGFLRWSSVVSGVLLVIMGILIMTGTMGSWSSWISNAAAEESAPSAMTAPDFTLQDQFGETHTLSAYQGKVVFLNFWATWCPWCIR